MVTSSYIRRLVAQFRQDTAGMTGVLWAMALPIVVGGFALSTDVGTWYYAKHDLQNATDAAAMSVGYELTSGSQHSALLATASSDLARNGFGSDPNITVTLNHPPSSGAYVGNFYAAEVIVQQLQSRYFSKAFLGADPTVRTRSVALRQTSDSACVLGLDTIQSDVLLFQGSATINMSNCVAAANSSNSSSIALNGNSTLTVSSLYTAGNYSVSGSSVLNASQSAHTNAPPLADPYSSIPTPIFGGCAQSNFSTKNTVTINPGVYCGGLDLKAHANVTMNPGTYIIDRGSLSINGQAQLSGNGVTIILTSSTGSNYPDVTINGGATVSLSASTSGVYSGMLFYQDRNAPVATNSNKFNGGSTTSFTGALYFPNQEVQFSGNNSTGGGACTKIVAKTITFTGNSYMNNNCPASVSSIPVTSTVQLVE